MLIIVKVRSLSPERAAGSTIAVDVVQIRLLSILSFTIFSAFYLYIVPSWVGLIEA